MKATFFRRTYILNAKNKFHVDRKFSHSEEKQIEAMRETNRTEYLNTRHKAKLHDECLRNPNNSPDITVIK